MKKFATAMVVFFGVFFSIDFVHAQTIRMGTLAPEGSVWHNALRNMAEEWQRLSSGSIRVRIYPGGVAGDDADIVKRMGYGKLQAAALTGEGLSNISEEISIFQMPMLLRSYAELDYVRDQLAPELEKLFKEQGFKVLYWSEVGWVYLFSNRPVVRPADLKPLKVWVWSGNAAWADALKDAGYQPVPLPATGIDTALQSGRIDAFSTTPAAALSYQWFRHAKNMMEIRWAPLTAAVVISMDTWDQIPENLRPEVEAAAVCAGNKAKAEIRNFEDEAIAAMKERGLQVNELTLTQVAEWQAEIEATYPKLVGESIPEDIYDKVANILAEYRAGVGGGGEVEGVPADLECPASAGNGAG